METRRTTGKAASLRWQILRQALLRRPPPHIPEEGQSETSIKSISRKTTRGFNLIPCQLVEQNDAVAVEETNLSGSDDHPRPREARLCYTLPIEGAPTLFLTQRVEERAYLGDFEICNRYNVDNTGLVCHWPSEEVLAYFCLSHADMFRSKRVIELGSGYGLAGLVIAAITEAVEVVISDGNPQVVDYIQRNIDANSGAFGATRVSSMTLHWDQEEISNISNAFDVIIASDCTFFKEFHNGLARIIRFLLKKEGPSEAIFLSPKRGNSLDKFLETIKQNALSFSVTENYNAEVWKHHQAFMHGNDSWPSYEKDHCYPLLVRITI
ncbi:calmodulin-lysine N-methyltransferase-like isoform X1 [Quercus lobata]|uniref:Calmodulin-lysine N-methyltransferase n=1 Tax=Quercus lobata TaxID=97700 RepID=A0A7N2M0Q6_QUELO|nr:calmodulin-lysine N-methyltransferase-like isoform X1 [Quercus lobata]XP_030945032.1 calmodulin-lysine N-methyltransferase-like isoform X1 [Quercus lobata]